MTNEKARALYQQLTPEQKHFVDNKTINTTLSVKHWISFLSRTSAYDRLRDNRATILAGWISVIIFFSLILVIIAFNRSYWHYIVPVIFVLAIILYVLVRQRIALGKRNMSNYLRNFFMPILEVLREKAGDDAKMIAALDFRDPLKALPFEEVKEPGLNRKIKLYTPKIIAAGVPLKDQSYLELAVVDEIRKMTIQRGGKTKYKTKVTHRLFIRLAVNKSVYQRNEVTVPDYVEVEEQPNQFVYKLKHKEKESGLGILEPKSMIGQMAVLYGLFSVIPGVALPSMVGGVVNQPNALQDMFWNDQIFSNYDRDGFSRSRMFRNDRSSRDQDANTFDS